MWCIIREQQCVQYLKSVFFKAALDVTNRSVFQNLITFTSVLSIVVTMNIRDRYKIIGFRTLQKNLVEVFALKVLEMHQSC